LWLLLSAERFIGGATDLLLRETDSAYKDITGKLDGYKKDIVDGKITVPDKP